MLKYAKHSELSTWSLVGSVWNQLKRGVRRFCVNISVKWKFEARKANIRYEKPYFMYNKNSWLFLSLYTIINYSTVAKIVCTVQIWAEALDGSSRNSNLLLNYQMYLWLFVSNVLNNLMMLLWSAVLFIISFSFDL